MIVDSRETNEATSKHGNQEGNGMRTLVGGGNNLPKKITKNEDKVPKRSAWGRGAIYNVCAYGTTAGALCFMHEVRVRR